MTQTHLSPALAELCRALNLAVPDAVPGDLPVTIACRMLAATRPWSDREAPLLDALLDAHRSALTDAVAWRAMRREAVALGDDPDTRGTALGRVAEAAAWPLDTSRSGLVELMAAVCQLHAARAAAATGWTDTAHEQAEAILQRIAKGDGTRMPERSEIPALFEAAHPVLAGRFVVQLNAANAAHAAFRGEVARWIAEGR